MATILVTGATGFIGRQTAAVLAAASNTVHGTTRRLPTNLSADLGADLSGIILHQADLLRAADRRAVISAVQPDTLVHLAWVTQHGHYWTASENDDWVAASADLVSAFRRAGGRRLLVAGTCAEYDWTDPALKTERCNEHQTPTDARTPYGRARVALFRHLAKNAHDLSWAWARIFFPFGPGEDPKRLVPSVIRPLLCGEEAVIGPGTAVRDFIDVRDVAGALAALLRSSVEGPVNIGTGKPCSIATVARRISELAGCPNLLKVGALPPRPDDPPHLVADVRRLSQEVGFTPRYERDAGLLHALKWWATQSATSHDCVR